MKNKIFTKMDLMTTLSCLLGILPGLVFYNKLPDRLPFHWGIENAPDSYGAKWIVVFLIPLLMCAFHAFLCAASNRSGQEEKMPEKARLLMRLIIPVLTIMLETVTVMFALDVYKNIGTVVTCFCAVLFILTGNYLPKARRNTVFGLKFPWTLKSDLVWNKSHRFAGWFSVVGGFVMLIMGLAELYVPAIVTVFATAIVPVVYSFIVYKKTKVS